MVLGLSPSRTDTVPAKSRRSSTVISTSRLTPTESKYRSISGSESEIRATRPPLTVGEVAELAGRGSRHRTVGGGNGITVRVTFGEAQFGVHPRDHQIGNGVFEDFGLVVDFVPAVSEFLNQIGLDQPVAPDHGDGGGAAAVGQGDGSVAGVIDQALVREFADRLGHRRGRDAHFLGQELGGNPLVGPLLDSPDDLEVVLGHRRECERVDCRVVRRSAVAIRRR